MTPLRPAFRGVLKRLALLTVALSVAAVCVRLGVWQLARHEGRRERNAAIAERLALSPVSLLDDPTVDSLEYRRVLAIGIVDTTRAMVEVGRAVNSVPAVYVVLPLRLDDGHAVLVEAGWIPSPDAMSVRESIVRGNDTVEVRGVLLAPRPGAMPKNVEWPLSVRFADPLVLGPLFPYPLHPWILRRTDWSTDPTPGLRPIPLPELTRGPHLSYAVQWFVFATIAVVGAIALLVTEAKASRTPPRESASGY